MNFNKIIYRLDLFSLPRSLFAIHRAKENPRQYYGSPWGALLSFSGILLTFSYFVYLI